MPWEQEATGVGELQTCLPASLSFLMTVGWLACLALGPQLRLCAQQSPDSLLDVNHAWGLERRGHCQAAHGGSAVRVRVVAWAVSVWSV